MSSIVARVWRLFAVGANVSLGRRVHVGFGSRLWAPSGLRVCDDVYIGRFCSIECDGVIGSGTLIANNVGVVGREDHAFRTIGTPVVHAPWVGSRDVGKWDSIAIGPDVWIGFGSVLLSGTTVGRGSVVAAGAVVTHDVAPYSIVAGNPAVRVGMRFSPDEIAEHERRLPPAYRPGDADRGLSS